MLSVFLADGPPGGPSSQTKCEYQGNGKNGLVPLDRCKSDLHLAALKKEKFKRFGSAWTQSSQLKNNERDLNYNKL
ncbi:hypothetical protein D7Z94_25000 [Ulvibacterium marinum]|uniref:Uncharacterized protein n=2 Tax=Ulvibacterium marinum TaxID=2419782 RepID=A0A3B0BRM4_9FLAO|nr:hypothetical protein D7Z94_25000 [Ulvibacterium marinum]